MSAVVSPATIDSTTCSEVTTGRISSSTSGATYGLTHSRMRSAPAAARRLSRVVATPYSGFM